MTQKYWRTASGLVFLMAVLFYILPDLSAQTFEPLRHEGTLNDDFTRGALTRYRSKASRQRVRGADQQREKANRNAFALRTAIALNAEHRSGSILIGNWLSHLIDSIGQRIAAADAKQNPSQARSKPVRFYVTASSAVNAFATADRTVYVTMGLLSRIETEAQLAFILCHELGHVSKRHNLDLYLKSQELAQNAATRRGRQTLSEDPFAINRYSRENETEADNYGTELYRALGYPASDAAAVFELLGDSYLTSAEHRLDTHDLAVYDVSVSPAWMLDSLVLPRSEAIRLREAEEQREENERLREQATSGNRRERKMAERSLEELDEANSDGEMDDNPSTHPALEERLEIVSGTLGDLAGESFSVWQPNILLRIRRQARYEVIDYNLRDGDYPEAILNAIALLNNEPSPDTAYLYLAITHALLGQTVFRKATQDTYNKLLEDLANAGPGVYRERVARNALERHQEWPDASYGYGELQRVYHLIDTAELDALAGLALAHAIRTELANPTSAAARVYTDRALELLHAVDSLGYSTWKKSHPKAYAAAASLKLETRYQQATSYSDLRAYNELQQERLEQQGKYNAALDSKGVVVAIPRFSDTGLSGEKRLERSSNASTNQTKLIKSSLRANNLPGKLISDRLGRNDSEELGDVRLLRDYLIQAVVLNNYRLIPHNYDAILSMLADHKADKIVYIAEANAQNSGLSRALISAFLYGALHPYNTIALGASRVTTGSLSCLVLDPAKRQVALTERSWYTDQQFSAGQRSMYYALFHQIKQRKKR